MKSYIKSIALAAGASLLAFEASAFENVDFTRVAESTVNSVVSVKSFADVSKSARQVQPNYFDPFENDPFFEYFFGPRQRRQAPKPETKESEPKLRQTGLGSGVIISTEGYIVTNNHVIDGAARLQITLNDNRSYDATVVGTDQTTDLAVIRIDAPDLEALKFGESDSLRVGEWVLAVGNPFGFTSSVTAGIVSAKGRNISSMTGGRNNAGIESFIQTDAALNPGNSGGALVNLDGELVGINAAIYSQTGNYAGTSFAIPSSIVRKVVDDILSFGTVQRAFLGVRYGELTPEIAEEKKITATVAGLIIGSVEKGSAAEEAGIKADDVIVAIGSHPTSKSGHLQEAIAMHSPGDKVAVHIIRDNKPLTVEATLRNAGGSTSITKAGYVAQLGCSFHTPEAGQLATLGIKHGLQVSDIEEGCFKSAGIRDGFIILDINNIRVNSAEDVSRLYDSIVGSTEYDHVMFITGVYPGTNRRVYYAVDLAPLD